MPADPWRSKTAIQNGGCLLLFQLFGKTDQSVRIASIKAEHIPNSRSELHLAPIIRHVVTHGEGQKCPEIQDERERPDEGAMKKLACSFCNYFS